MEQVARLHLKRPLVFFDLETTGTKVGVDRIVEMAMVKLMPDGRVIKKPEEPGREHRILINPEMPIPVESSLVHGVYDDEGLPVEVEERLSAFFRPHDDAFFEILGRRLAWRT